MIGNLEIITEETIEASETLDQGQVLEQLPIGTGLDVCYAIIRAHTDRVKIPISY